MEKMAITVVLMLLLVAIMATPTFASGISFESLPHLSIQNNKNSFCCRKDGKRNLAYYA